MVHRCLAFVATLLFTGVWLGFSASAGADTTILITTTADTTADDGQCSLREALVAANTDTASGATAGECLAGSGTDLLSMTTGTYLLGSTLPEITTSLRLLGNGSTIDADGNGSVLRVSAGSVQLDRLTLTGGSALDGAGLRVVGATAMTFVDLGYSTVTGNTSTQGGAGIVVSNGFLELFNSTIAGNNATGAGGGLLVSSGSSTINASTFSGNTAAQGGGIFAVDGEVRIFETTITDNSATAGSGVLSHDIATTQTSINQSIVAANQGTGNDIDLNSGTNDTFTSGGHNILGTIGAGISSFGPVTNDLTGQNPRLGPLTNNGGATATHALLAGSPAIDHGPVPFGDTDQRDVRRPEGPRSDAGSFERRTDKLTVPPSGHCALHDSTSASGSLAGPIAANTTRTIQVTGPLPADQGVGTGTCVPTDATAVVFTVAARGPQGVGNLRLSASGVVANGGVLNYTSNGLDNANTVTVPISAGGQVDLFANNSATGVRLVAVGYYSSTGTLTYHPLVPCAVGDSRPAQGATGSFAGPFAGDTTTAVTLDVVGTFPTDQGGGNTTCGVPTGADAVVVNVVAVRPPGGFGGTGNILAGSGGGGTPTDPVTPFADLALNNATTTVIPLSGGETVATIVSGPSGTSSHIRVVVLGYLDDFGGANYTPVNPCAGFDTRSSQGSTGVFTGLRNDQSTTTYALIGTIPTAQGGNGGDCGVPAQSRAVLLNTVAIGPNQVGNFRAAAAGTNPTGGIVNFAPLTPSLNNANAVVVPLSAAGQIDLFTNAPQNSGGPTVNARGVILGYYGPNQPPATISRDIVVPENQTAVVDIDGIDDVDREGAGLSYSHGSGIDNGLFSIDATTGVLTFDSPPDFEDPRDFDANNGYDVAVNITDSEGLVERANLSIFVADVTEPFQLQPGDIAIIGLHSDSTDEFSWVPLVDLPAGEVLYFSDAGYSSAAGAFQGSGRTEEWLLRYTVPAGGLSAGAVQTVTDGASPANYDGPGTTTAFGAHPIGPTIDLNMVGLGEELIVFQSSDDPTTSGFGQTDFRPLFQVDSGSFNRPLFTFVAAALTHTTDLHPGLAVGTNAVGLRNEAIPDEWDNIRYNGTRTGTAAQLRAAIANSGNWQGTDTAQSTGWTAGSGNFTVS